MVVVGVEVVEASVELESVMVDSLAVVSLAVVSAEVVDGSSVVEVVDSSVLVDASVEEVEATVEDAAELSVTSESMANWRV